ncbi:tRNA lysidine(34) synthetase TilS [Azotobacter beijerinckii]|uniref:tRNA(Ile)-lysidine synthase n=1 Tax=Azotobacter beijerinckii TaxID=170623 RepID=A0A1I3Z433_9GAMM|nr:tRNA lysidine(34) synthetase TilS [Azotobacter beijerinckii]SFA73384.1 tRNA(Ile)-lysidine synthase [Azotobacter beijerinckii]SFK38309.1 tRNA(Ile)-lysidine synthase [Azotobacter beijerinckii]
MSLESRLLAILSPWCDAPGWRLAFSGGLDSTVLLHLVVRLGRQHGLPPLSALHVHHGLQVVADDWPEHCRQVCARLGVPLQVLRVRVEAGASLERAAREARYRAFAEVLGEGELLLTAQHQDDQAETLLFRLLRGAGVRGLAAMPAVRTLGRGRLLRPLLGVSRGELERYAVEQGLQWIEDPSNRDQHFSRNFLRHRVLPLLTERWPQAVRSMARSAAHMAEARELLDDLARLDLAAARGAGDFPWLGLPSLALAPLLGLSPARQRNALRHWLEPFTPLPDADHWAGWEALREAAVDAAPVWRLVRGEMHRAAGRIWWLAGDWLRPPAGPLSWVEPTRPLALPGNGCLQLQGRGPAAPLEVRYRRGGEVLAVPGRGHRDLKRLLNERGLPAFVRGRLPLLYRGNELLAVAGVPGLDGSADGAFRLLWRPPENVESLS